MSAKNIVDAYPLSPLQEGMLFHSLYEPEGGAYVTQLAWTFLGPLDADAFETAWQRVVDRHPILRTAFAWKNLERPIQVVGRAVRLALAREDWRSLEPGERERLWEDLLQADRKRGFDLSRAPLLRLVLIEEAENVHRFLWTHHHILLDGWSLTRVMGEVVSLYEARRRGEDLELPPCPPFRRYIEWLSKQDMTQAEIFWRAELAGFTSPTPLLAGSERPAVNGATGPELERTLRLPESTVEALQARARSSQLTLNTMAQAAWALLLGRASGEDDVLFGVTVSGRPPALPGVEAIVGMFINTLPLRVDVRPDQPLLPWLRGLQERQLEMRNFEHSPLVRIQGWSEVPRGLSLFHSFLVFENFPADRGVRRKDGGSGLEVRDMRAFERANYPLGLVVNSHLALRLTYDADRFDATAITRLLGHLVLLLEGLAAGTAERISDLAFLSEAERQQVTMEWNDSRAIPTPAELGGAAATIHGLCEAWARLTPEAPAVVCDGEVLTYRQLDRRANHLAHLLSAYGVGPEVRVGLCLRRSPELPVSLLAILKAGGAFVPLDIAYPAERLAYLLDDAQISVLVSEEALVGQLPLGGPRLEVLVDGPGGSGERDVPPDGGAAPENLAYLIYTSGSTGHPKGVMVHHRGAINTGMSLSHLFDVRSDSRVLQFSSSSFDASISEIMEALRSGAALCLADGEALLPGPGLLGALRDPGVTHATLPPTVLSLLPEQELPALRSLIVAGEACPAELPVRWGRGRRFFNAYGPTEASVCATVKECAADGRPPNIGRPIPGARVHILDWHLRRTPVGVAGELYIGGTGVARGYSDRPALTAERFVPDPFGSQHGKPGARLYRTGDLARYLPDGEIAYLGRIDHQVKVRGFRIEPGEIETALAQHPGVREALVLAREGGGEGASDLRLVAYVTASPASGTSPEGLRRFLQERLPEHMVPSAFVILESFPLTPSGKVDRAALPAPDRPAATLEVAVPRSQGEQLLADIWAEVLGVEQVGRGDNFFDLGGHSLLATQVASRVRTVFGLELPVQAIFEQPVLAALAAHLEEAMRAMDGVGAPPLVPVPRDLPLPLSFAQQRLWFLDRLVPDSPVYNLPLQAHLSGPLRLDALAGALAEIVRRHEALRTRFEEPSTEEPVQRIDPPRRLSPPLVDLSGLPSGVCGEEARRLAREEAVLPFDLARGPLLRASLLRLEGEEHAALLTTHHIVSDGWSLGLLTAELSALYAAACQGRPSPLPEPPIQYADFAAWQRGWLTGEVLERQIAAWKQRLQGAPQVLALPTDRPRPAVQRYRGALCRLSLSGSLAGALREVCRRERVSAFMALLAVFQTLLMRYARQEDVSVGTPIAGRNWLETEKLIGFFVNTLVLRTDLSGSPTFSELLGRVRKVSLEAHAHQDLPFEKLVEELQPDRSLSHSPLFQVMFALQNAPQEEHELPGLTLRALGQDTGTAKFDLTLSMAELGDRLQAVLDYDVDLFDASSIERMLAHFEILLRGALDGPGTRITELPLLTEDERLQILFEWNQTAAEPPAEQCLHEAFEAQAERRPEATALVVDEERLTYGELDRRANRLARHLRDLGVGPEVQVGVCLKRTQELVITLLAILKAGGSYVPLDPESPSRRLAAILEDAKRGVPVLRVVTSGALADRLPVLERLRLVRLDWEAQTIALQSAEQLKCWATGGNLAYLIYTSGSTGIPKGVAITHRSAIEMVGWARRAFAPRELEAVLASTSITFDLSVFELFVPLAVGGRVVLARDALQLVDLPARGEVTLVNTVPSAMAELLRLSPLPAAVRTVCLAGEPLPAELARALHQQPGVERVLNLYGPSEDTTYSTWAEIPPEFEGAPPIGIPISNTRSYLLDPFGLPVPVGVAGELHLGGAGLARGYFHQPVWTAERFVPDPFAGPGGRLYRTGDLARWRPDGQLDFLGRIDHQVKLRGFRIELREIEAALVAHGMVREAVVVVREDRPGDRRLTGYAVLAEGEEQAERWEAALREHLRATLPGYMIPSALVVLDALPLTPNGKVDRKALPAPSPGGGEESGRPRTPAEELLAGIWCEVLGLQAVGVHDNFFALGGHSLLATRIVSRVCAAFQVELPLRSLFETPTIAGLAACLANAGRGAAPALGRAPRTGDLPLSFAQQRLWFLDQLERDSARYNMTQGVRLLGDLNATALRQALDEVVRRHEVLRTTYSEVGESPVQRIAPPAAVPLPRIDLGSLPAELRETEMGGVVARWERLPFDLARGPVLRVCLICLGARENVLLLTIHHIAADAWSIRLLVHEVTVLYAAAVRGEPSPLPELPIQYGDHAYWERSWLQGETLKEQLAWWRRRLAGSIPELDLPTDRPRPQVPSDRGGLLLIPLPDQLAAGLRALSREEGATLFITLLAAYATLLYRSTGQEDLVVGADLANRTRPETESLIGLFLNMLALRLDLSGCPSFRALLRRVREVVLGALSHQDLPFDRLVEELQPQRGAGHSPLFRVVFSFNSDPRLEAADRVEEMPGITARPLETAYDRVRFDLVLRVNEAGERLTAAWGYSADLFQEETVGRMHRRWVTLLRDLLERPDVRLDDLAVLGEEEKAAEEAREQSARDKLKTIRGRRSARS